MKTKSIILILFLTSMTMFGQQQKEIKKTDYKFRMGGYGEMLYQHFDYGANRYNPKNGAKYEKRSNIDLPRFILSLEYKFTPSIQLVTEIEFEHGGTGSAVELEFEESGEFEMEAEKGGEVVLEQFHISKKFSDLFTLRLGHMIVPVGATNKRHLPIEYFSTTRPEGENTIIPLTWHETGIAVLGNYGKWDYELQMVSGLDANGFSSAHWVQQGAQKKFEKVIMTSPAFVGRIENRSIRNLRLGASYYYCDNTAANTQKALNMKNIKSSVSITSFDFTYATRNLIARGNVIYGDITDTRSLYKYNQYLADASQYSRTPIASNALSYSFEAGYNVMSLFGNNQRVYPFVGYEYYNAMEDVEKGILKDVRHQTQKLTAGVNYYVLPNLVLKADYSKRKLKSINDENTFSIALGYTGWFFQK